MVAVDFSPRVVRARWSSRGAMAENVCSGLSSQASLRDALSPAACLWTEVHGYHQTLAPRGCFTPAITELHFQIIPKDSQDPCNSVQLARIPNEWTLRANDKRYAKPRFFK
jgi:hypothetical protein